MQGQLEQGIVARWRDTFGFITPDVGGADVFVHYSDIDAGGFRKLEPGQRVQFCRTSGEHGAKAVSVVVL